MITKLKITIACLALVLISTPAASLDNYWDSFGSPQLQASLAGTNEFDRGDTVKLYIDLTNYGRILGLDEDKTAETRMENELSDREFEYEQALANALNITATLQSGTDLIVVQSDEQVVESLKSGDKTQAPLEYAIEIASHAPADTYPMLLDLTYDYQYNVQVDADQLDLAAGLIGLQVSYLYRKANQTFEIPVVIKRQADFKIIGTDASLAVGKNDGNIAVTYKNIGEEPAKEAVVRLSIFNPFSSIDDQAFIGTIQPGEETTVVFKLDVDSDATAKDYVINSEVKYIDVEGDSAISESMKIPVNVAQTGGSGTIIVVLAALIALTAAGFYLHNRRKHN
jgi:LPXTG-motif cell wall-anchored protein